MKLENYTGRTLSVARAFGSADLVEVPADPTKQAKLVTPGGVPDRLDTLTLPDGRTIEVYAQLTGEVVGLPDPVPGVMYLVPLPVYSVATAAGRTDLLTAGMGRFSGREQVACEGLSRLA